MTFFCYSVSTWQCVLSHIRCVHLSLHSIVTPEGRWPPWIFQEREKINLVSWARCVDTMMLILCGINIYIGFIMKVLMLKNFIEKHWNDSIVWVRLFLIPFPVVYVCDCPDFFVLYNEYRASHWKRNFRMLQLVPQSGRVTVTHCLKQADWIILFLKYSIRSFVCIKYVYIIFYYFICI